MRGLSKQFLDDLKSGVLMRLNDIVTNDETLCLEIRENSVDVYYRGGRLFNVKKGKNYELNFNEKYLNHGNKCKVEPLNTALLKTMDDYLNAIPLLKREMDFKLKYNRKQERESQQLILRENNFGVVSRSTDYYICDIEYARKESNPISNVGEKNKPRFDMVGVKWMSKSLDRQNRKPISLALFELKYGDNALTGRSGIVKHFKDLDYFFSKGKHLELMDEAQTQFNQKYYLNLIDMKDNEEEKKHSCFFEKILIDPNIKPEYILIFANHDPDSSVLRTQLRIAIDTYPQLLDMVDIKIARSSLMGYGLYADHMVDIKDFLGL